MRRFEGRVAFISGAGSGIGLAAAQRIAEEGGRVVCGVETEAQRAATGDFTSIVIDVANEGSWRAAIDQTVAEHGGLDVLVCSAGILRKGTAEGTSLELWNQVLAVNQKEHSVNYKSILQQHLQREDGSTPNYRVLSESGPDHAKEFVVQAMLKRDILGTGQGNTKKEAEQEAARAALDSLGVDPAV